MNKINDNDLKKIAGGQNSELEDELSTRDADDSKWDQYFKGLKVGDYILVLSDWSPVIKKGDIYKVKHRRYQRIPGLKKPKWNYYIMFNRSLFNEQVVPVSYVTKSEPPKI